MAGLSLLPRDGSPTPTGGMKFPLNTPAKKKPITPAQAYSESIPQQTQDYSEIMGRFRSALDRPSGISSLMQNYQNILSQAKQPLTDLSSVTRGYEDILGREAFTPEEQKYERGPELTEAFGNLSELSRTGGYSEGDIANLRERGISPIRSVYANAMRNLERNKSLQGGYAPGAGAATAKMARELSSLLSGKTTDVNAAIAEAVAGGRRTMAPQYAGFAERETGMMSDIARRNLEAKERAEQFNLQRELEALRGLGGAKGMEAELGKTNIADQLAALGGMAGLEQLGTGRESELLRGMTSLYGTSPALADTFGRQTLAAAELDARNRPQYPLRRAGGISLNRSAIPLRS